MMIVIFSLVYSLVVAQSVPDNYQMSRLICNGHIVAEYIFDRRTTKWFYINETWVFMQYDNNILAEYKPINGELCYVVNTNNYGFSNGQ